MDFVTHAPIRVATRRSQLATTQAQLIADELARLTGRPTELVEVTTVGDVTKGSLSSFGGVGVFVGAVREAVLDGRADVGVHSLKDLPTYPEEGLIVAAIPRREDPSDALCATSGSSLDDLAPGVCVGTGSLRRAAQLRALRPDLTVVDIRGNVETRLAKVTDGELAGVILATAGLHRLAKHSVISARLNPQVMLSAPGQGALAVETRTDLESRDADLHKALSTLDDCDTRAAVTSERAVLNELQAGCSAPVAALAVVSVSRMGSERPRQDRDLFLQALVASTDGSQVIRLSVTGPAGDADRLGRELATELLAAGAASLLGEPRQ